MNFGFASSASHFRNSVLPAVLVSLMALSTLGGMQAPTPAQMGAILKGQILLTPPDSARTFVPFNDFRKELQDKYGVGVYAISQTLFARNTLSPAVPTAQIAYPGNDI